MDSYNLLPSANIKLEPACETDHVHCCAEKLTTDVKVTDVFDSKLPVSVKIEQPEVKLEYQDQDKKTLTCSQIVPSLTLQEHSQMEKKVCGNFNFGKQELSDEFYEDKHQRFDKMIDVIDCSSGLEITGHSNTESRMTQNSFGASQEHESFSQISDNISSLFEVRTKHSLVDSNQLQNSVEINIGDISCKSSMFYCFTYKNCQLQINEGMNIGDKSCISDVCDSTVSVDNCLTREKRKETTEETFKCGDCGTSFDQAGKLKIHKRTHTGERPYKCDDCGASFSDASNLRRHKVIHTGERPYTCNDCGTSFAQAGSLKTHKRTHTGERPYKCDDCGTSFNESGSLKKHKRIHTGERPYKCDDCGASFTEAGSLKSHKRKHTGERPYKCDDCGTSFTQASSLLRHKRKNTGDFKCDG